MLDGIALLIIKKAWSIIINEVTDILPHCFNDV